jgi:hypothetical protein
MKKPSRAYLVQTLALGWPVLVMYCVALFWLRWETWRAFTNGAQVRETAQPSGLIPGSIEEDPNVTVASKVLATCTCDGHDTLWISDLVYRGDSSWPIIATEYDREGEVLHLTYWDEQSGLFVLNDYAKPKSETGRTSLQSRRYAGPDGVSDRPAKELGRFIGPVVVRPAWLKPWKGIVYDGGSRQFCRIDFDGRRIAKGPAIPAGLRPLQIGMPQEREGTLSLDWTPPLRPAREGEKAEYLNEMIRVYPRMGLHYGDQALVLNGDSRIYVLDVATLTLTGPVGELPAVGLRSSNRPKDLLAYSIRSLHMDHQYAGCVVAAVAADGTDMELQAFDKEGRRIAWGEHYSKTGFMQSPGASGALASRYVLECLHPLSLSLLSVVLGPRIEAMAGHRGLFVLADSFVATHAASPESYVLDRIVWVAAMLLPAIFLAAWLGWKVSTEASTAGLSGPAVRGWTIATVAFGVPAYITYRLTRPRVTLVTCLHCGNPRRPDMERCHRCGAPWQVPELAAPSWQVKD